MSQFFDEIKLEAKRKREEKDFLRINKDVCQRLEKNGENERIYQLFGQRAYRKYANKNYQRKDLQKLKKEKRYEEINVKYGEKLHDKLLLSAMYQDIKQEKGNVSAFLWKIRKLGYRSIAIFFSALFLAISSDTLLIPAAEINQNKKTYAEQISKSDFKIEEYVKKFEGKKLTDLQVIMKVVDDMWANIEGYKDPPLIDANGCLELDVTRANGYGICRNFATYVAKVLQAMGYKARTLPVYMDLNSYQYYVCPNIQTKEAGNETEQTDNIFISDDSQNDLNSNENDEDTQKINDWLQDKKITANHMVVLVYIEEDDIYLVIDPTNPGIGILDKNSISMFNNANKENVNLLPKPFSFITNSGIYGVKEFITYFLGQKHVKPEHNEYLEKKYSITSQNTALEQANKVMDDTRFTDDLKKEVDLDKIDAVSKGFQIKTKSEPLGEKDSKEISK